jgi:ribose 1,5-bisphosphokinase PhnN
VVAVAVVAQAEVLRLEDQQREGESHEELHKRCYRPSLDFARYVYCLASS